MLAATLLVVASVLWWCNSSASPVESTGNMTEFNCSASARQFDVRTYFRTMRFVSVRVANSSYDGQCIVNVTLETLLDKRQPELSQPLLLVKFEQLQLNSAADHISVSMSNPVRWTSHCLVAYCLAPYLWASESVELHLYVTKSSKFPASYVAAFIVTEATNVCGLAGRSGELMVWSKEYVFAPDSRHTKLPPNNVTCAHRLQYSLTIRSTVSSGSLNVTVLACPRYDSCENLLLNGRNCSDGVMMATAPPGSPVTLHYVRGRCDGYRDDGYRDFQGFLVSVAIYPSGEPSEKSSRATTASLTAVFCDPSSESNLTESQVHGELTAWNSTTCIIITVIVVALSTAVFIIGITMVFRARRQLRIALIAQPAMQSRSPMLEGVSGGRIGNSKKSNEAYESLATASDTHLYEVTMFN